ncbi:MAG: DUF2779 domain-containing protein [Lentisphaerae bacterium]|nr:DUF2779 domain-containing protein [Lentisphaerota bacterium]
MPTNLTKSRFKLGWECATTLYYADRRKAYFDTTTEDTFLQGLAEGGYQVGEFARWMLCDDPARDTIATLDKPAALAETDYRLRQEHATIAEAAFRHEALFMRADIVVKNGTRLDLYEVKSKSWDSETEFWTKRGDRRPNATWEPYLLDVAFQKHVIEKARPDLTVRAFLVLLDKDRRASVDGLCQMFPVFRPGGKLTVQSRADHKEDLGANLLAYLDVDRDIAEIRKLPFTMPDNTEGSFEQLIQALAGICTSGRQAFCGVGAKCRKCQFRLPSPPEAAAGMRDGREECWAHAVSAAGRQYDPAKPKVIEVWNYRKADEALQMGRHFVEDLTAADLGDGKLAPRQWLQVDKVKRNDGAPSIDRAGLAAEMQKWKFPLHFIDFETARMALPAQKGMAPYTQVAFQFSHHTVDRGGRVRHAGQWIETGAGVFPSFAFVRELKHQLEQDRGTIFRYATHENTVLRDIRGQLDASREPDRKSIIAWIDSVTQHKPEGGKPADTARGPRNMVDMREVVLSCHYEPATHGSNSLKAVLPAIIGSSADLRNRYGRPLGENGLHSLNFGPDWVWVRPEKRNDPYAALPAIFKSRDEQEAFSAYVETLEDISDGGAATIAYAKLQFFDLPGAERTEIREALLRYCELDTLAMVMLHEYWREATV